MRKLDRRDEKSKDKKRKNEEPEKVVREHKSENEGKRGEKYLLTRIQHINKTTHPDS